MENFFKAQTTASEHKSGNVEIETHVIYRYSDLSFGKMCSVNRDVRKAHVRSILHGLEDGTWNRLGQIYVDVETKEIVDGNHRYEALSMYFDKYGSFNGNKVDVIYYQREPNETLADAIIFFNNDRKALNAKDYSKLSEYNGNEAIPQIREFGLNHEITQKLDIKTGLPKTFSERYAYQFIYGRNVTKEVKNGTITITQSQLDFAHKLHEEINGMLKACNKKVDSWIESFISAWYAVRNDSAFNRQFNKFGINLYIDQFAEDANGYAWEKNNKTDWIMRFNGVISNLID